MSTFDDANGFEVLFQPRNDGKLLGYCSMLFSCCQANKLLCNQLISYRIGCSQIYAHSMVAHCLPVLVH